MQTKPIVEIAEDAGYDAAQRNGQPSVLSGASDEQPVTDSNGSNDRKPSENQRHSLTDAEERSFVEAGLQAENIGRDDDNSAALAGHFQGVEDPMLGREIDGAATDCKAHEQSNSPFWDRI